MQSKMLGENMKKTIILIITCLLLVGCKAEYKINITDEHIYDTIKIYEKSEIVNDASNDEVENVNEWFLDWERGYEDYLKELYSDGKNTGYKYTNDYTIDEYDYISQLSKCYDSLNIVNTDTISIKSSNEFLCGDYYEDVDEMKITIETDYKIIGSNADIKEGNKHTWIINRNNYTNKPININIKKEKQEITKTNTISKNKINSLLVIIIFILLIILLLKINKKKNKE